MVENGRKWWKMDFRDYLVGNPFSRILRHSPTTCISWPTKEVRLTLQNFAEIGSHGFPRFLLWVSR